MFSCFSNVACIGPVNNDESFRACVENQFCIQNIYLYGKGGHDTEEGEEGAGNCLSYPVIPMSLWGIWCSLTMHRQVIPRVGFGSLATVADLQFKIPLIPI